MQRMLTYLIGATLLAGCATQRKQPEKEYWIPSYKQAIIISALKQAIPKVDSMDSTPATTFDLIGDYRFKVEADSIGKAFYQTIKPAPVFREQGWKPVLKSVLEYYSSKELDRWAKAAYKRYKIARKATEALY
ncbi:hypothetical protein [Chitinophaga sp. XS-30]|uniref:hypothetical protein n=1 Tax=Chitinophaga sp. XS-30 TaxID=2604421 RepID=UPI0011DC866E|nr:hypothetical protein [Chitinophaga sp. XS-30]QEH40924.1 hypothetical protein FW415_08575 [Chitinophaga sp. XS-30]